MGREIRRVPPGWEHPKETDPDDRRGMGYHPMHGENYEQALKEWVDNHNLWVDGEHPDQQEAGSNVKYYAEWEGNPPAVDDYIKYTAEEATHFQMYETVTEGTPVTPVFVTLKELEDWLVEKGELHGTKYETRFSREDAAAFCRIGNVPTLHKKANGPLLAGVNGMSEF